MAADCSPVDSLWQPSASTRDTWRRLARAVGWEDCNPDGRDPDRSDADPGPARTPLCTTATARLPRRIQRCAVRTACCYLHRLESFARSTTHPVLLLRCAHVAALPECRGAVRMVPHCHRAHRRDPDVPHPRTPIGPPWPSSSNAGG